MIDDLEFFQSKLLVDQNELDRELVEQPTLFHRICDRHVQAVSRRDHCKETLKQKDAESALSIRRELQAKGEKTTEKMIESYLEKGQIHTELVDQLLQLSFDVGRWVALKDAFLQRAFVLRDLVSLYVNNYWSQDSVKEGSQAKIAGKRYEENKKVISEKRRGKTA